MTEIKKQLADALCAAAGGALDAETLCAAFEYPPSADMGDLAFPCFRLSKTLRKAPPAIAAELAQGYACPAVARVEVAGGYLNFFLDKDYLAKHVIARALQADVPKGSSTDGAGKTALVRGLARALGYQGAVTSPTFAIVNDYRAGGKTVLYNFDIYRLDAGGLDDIGWDDYLARGGVCAVEWSENVEDALQDAIRVTIEKDADEPDARHITIKGGPRFEAPCL